MAQKVEEGVQIIDDYQVVFRLKHAAPEFLHTISANTDLVMESKARWDAGGKELYGKKVVGTGPFEFVERKVGVHVLYKRVENHWRKTPEYKELEWRWVPEGVTRLATLLTEEVNIETGKKWGSSGEVQYNPRMSTTIDVSIYQLKVVLLGISPMIWRRLLVRGDSTIADLHHVLQIAMGWTDTHLHQFRIHGKKYGVARLAGIGFRDHPHQVRLADLGLRLHECFFYDYDFGDHWQHQLRVEAILTPEPNRGYPICVAGTRACPPEDCGGPWAFMTLRQQYSMFHIAQRLEDIIDSGDRNEYVEELHDLRYWLTVDRFDRTTVNRRLRQYARGDEAWQWA